MGQGRQTAAAPRWIDPRTSGGADEAPGPGGGDSGAGPARWDGNPRLQAAASRGLATALWVALALALLLGLLNWVRTPTPVAAPATSATTPTVTSPPPGGCAELAVATWLAGEPDPLAGVPATPADPPPRRAAHTYLTAVTGAGSAQRWGYLVAAQVQERDDADRWHDLGLQYFHVTMVEAGGGCQGWHPAAPPMQVAAPAPVGEVPLPYPARLASSGTELSATLTAFFRGLLTGTGDMERYLAPGVTVPPVVPPPYGAVDLTELRARSASPLARSDEIPPDGTTVQLLATVAADRAALPLTYPVTVAVRGGRWEVVAVDPLVAAPPAAPTAAPTAAPPAGPTTVPPGGTGAAARTATPAPTHP